MLMKRSHIKGIYIYVIHAYSCNSRRTCRLTETNDYTWSLFSGFHSTSSPLIVTQKSGEFYFIFVLLVWKRIFSNVYFISIVDLLLLEVHFKNFSIQYYFWKIESRIIYLSFFFFFLPYFWIIKKFYSRSLLKYFK